MIYILYLRVRAAVRKREKELPQSVELAPVRVEHCTRGALVSFENIAVPQRIRGVSGDFPPGTLSIIMGGSGAGKSSLLSALIGFLPIEGGRIFFDGTEANLADRRYRDRVGFVPQHDVLLETLSVKENVSFAANLRLREHGPERRARVKHALKRLMLWEVRHSIVANISGGQRRRCSMAMELVCDPSVLFCDEVTSGLDRCVARRSACGWHTTAAR